MGKVLVNRNAKVTRGKQKISIDQLAESIAGSKIDWPIFENINSNPYFPSHPLSYYFLFIYPE